MSTRVPYAGIIRIRFKGSNLSLPAEGTPIDVSIEKRQRTDASHGAGPARMGEALAPT